VQFKHHIHALACLRELAITKDYTPYLSTLQKQLLESNPTALAQLKDRLIVEFCVENINKVTALAFRYFESINEVF
jgi:hypothetical protein